eukprot:g5374.t1
MPASAVQCLRAALEVQRTQLDAHPSVARTLHNLGNALAADGQGQAARISADLGASSWDAVRMLSSWDPFTRNLRTTENGQEETSDREWRE